MEIEDILKMVECHPLEREEIDLIIDSLVSRLILKKIDTRSRVLSVLRSLVNLQNVSADSVSIRLCMSCRTLHRKLNAEEVSFIQLLEKERKRRCINLLENKVIKGEDISYLVGFSDPTYFYKKFHIWFGFKFRDIDKYLTEESGNVGTVFCFKT